MLIKTFSEYIDLFISKPRMENRPVPGEHHFVSAYLLDRVVQLTKRIPDYINPDGTKNVIGDLVYFKNKRHQFGIEVKLDTIRLTKNEFNSWIASDSDKNYWPDLFLGIGNRGLILLSWSDFRDQYIASVSQKNDDWLPIPIKSQYGPQKSVDELFRKNNKKSGYFTLQKDSRLALICEKKFVKLLKNNLMAHNEEINSPKSLKTIH